MSCDSVWIALFATPLLVTIHAPIFLQETQLEACRLQALVAQSESDYLRDQITTTEVSMARVYNHGVAVRREQTAVKA